MSRRYVPPSKRGLEPVEKKAVEINNLNDFPSLTNSAPKTIVVPQRSFSALASEWNVKAEEDRRNEEYRQADKRREIEKRERDCRNVVSLNNIHVFHQDYRDNEETPLVTKDEWTTIDRKRVVVELSAEEKDARERAREENKQADTVWTEDLNDADWGFRDRRSNQ